MLSDIEKQTIRENIRTWSEDDIVDSIALSIEDRNSKFKKTEKVKAAFNDKFRPDCGDNSCRFAAEKGGMRTNGGCRCLIHPKQSTRMYFERLFLAVKEMLEES